MTTTNPSVAPTHVPAFGPPLETPAAYHRIARAIKQAGSTSDSRKSVRVAVLSSYTINFIEPFLRVECARLDLAVDCFWGGFGEFESLVMDESSALYAFQPDVLVFALRPEDISRTDVTRVWRSNGEQAHAFADQYLDRIRSLLLAFRSRSRAAILTANVIPPVYVASPTAATQPMSSAQLHARLNDQIAAAVRETAHSYVWDYEGLVADCGAREWTDPRLWFTARIPVAARYHGAFAQHLARSIHASLQPSAKVLVLDLDNTIWGGVIGDDGIEGIRLSDDWPGSMFKEVQRLALALRDRGILLTVLSKNDEAIARDAIEHHPEMLLRWNELAATSISWHPKSEGIAAIAEELNLGVDALVFLDDNPVERAEVAQRHPSVKIIDVNAYPSVLAALAACPWFDQFQVSNEDLARPEMYVRERARHALASEIGNLEDFLRALEMQIEIRPFASVDRQRIAQLFAKTNQFNLTQRRFTESDLDRIATDSDSGYVLSARLRDRFGDHGLVSAAVLIRDGDIARIDSFVMSCRVMNRRVEDAMLAALANAAIAWGCPKLCGEFVPSARNGMVRDFFIDHGFCATDDVRSPHTFDLAAGSLLWPDVLTRQ